MLKPALKTIIIENHKHLTYECVWDMLEHLDKDYDAQIQNSITEFYTGNSNNQRGDKSDSPPTTWNREHVWPQGRGFKRKNNRHIASSDMHHIVAANTGENNFRGNRQFCDEATRGGREIVKTGIRTVTATKNKNWAYEPRDEVKGRIARMLFYIHVRYDGEMELVGGHVEIETTPRMGYLKTMWKWHCKYPAKEEEIARNNEVNKYQGNRNPFVDDPLFAQLLWKFKCVGSTVVEDQYPDQGIVRERSVGDDGDSKRRKLDEEKFVEEPELKDEL